MNDQTGQLNQLDKLVLVNTAMFYKLMLEENEHDDFIDKKLLAIDMKLDIILAKLGDVDGE